MKFLRSKKKQLRKRRLLTFSFIGLLVAFLVFLIVKVYLSLGQGIWEGESPINIVFEGDSIFIASFRPANENFNLLIIPEETFIEAIHGYGPYRVESLVKLGEMEGYGGDFLSGSFQEYLGLPIDGYILANGEFSLDNDLRKVKISIVKTIVSLLRGRGETNLHSWDLIKFGWKIIGLKESKINLFDLAEMTVFSETVLPDGTQAAQIDTLRLERIINRLFLEEGIRNGDLAIAVLNGTGKTGLAKQAARIISNIGGRVISEADFKEAKEGSWLKGKRCEIRSSLDYKESYTVKRLSEIFGCSWVGEEKYEQRADVVLIVGENYWRYLNLP
jgi:hypothetical protein